MASNGTYTAWQRLRPLEGSVVDDLKDREELDMNQRAQNREDAKLRLAQEEKKKREKDEFKKNTLQDLAFSPTGVQTIDEYNIRSLNLAKEQMAKDYERGQQLYSKPKLSPEEQQELTQIEVRSNSFKNLPENLAAFTKGAQEQISETQKGILDGKYYDDDKFRLIREKGLAAFTPSLDKNGEVQAGLGDLDGDGEFEVIKWSDVNNALAFKPMQKYDPNEVALSTAKSIGYDEKDMQRGFRTEKTKEWKDANFKNAIDTVFNNFDAVRSFAREYKIGDYNNLTAGDIEKVRSEFEKSVRRSEDTQKSVKYDNTEARLTAEARRAGKGKEEKPKVSAGEGVVPTQGAWGAHYKNVGSNALSVPLLGDFVLPSLSVRTGTNTKTNKGVYRNITDARVENFTYDKNGKLLLDLSYSDAKTSRKETEGETNKNTTTTTSKEKSKYQVQATDETESRLAKALGMSISEMKAMADKRSQTGVGTVSVGEVIDGYRFKGGDTSDPANWEQVK